MANAIEVSDYLSNSPEQLEKIARVIGTGDRRKVFDAIYHHKMRVKSITEIMARSNLSRTRVLQEARELYRKGVIKSAPKKNEELAYEMIETVHAHKRELQKLASSRSKLNSLPTKRRPQTTVNIRVVQSRGSRPKAVKVTIDDIESFKAVRKVRADGYLPKEVSEDAFKQGVRRILREPADWKDWGGEILDFVSTRLRMKGKRVASAFAFKGPGKAGPLVPGKMGKNGDQLQRMFIADARLFVVQYWQEIKLSVETLMRALAVEKSDAVGAPIFYAVMDGVDSNRLFRAYPSHFAGTKRRKKRKAGK